MKSALAWIGVALLAASWLPAVGYYHLPSPVTWLVLVLGGTVLLLPAGHTLATRSLAEGGLAGQTSLWPPRKTPKATLLPWGLAAAMLVPAILLAPWPDRLALLLIAAGLLLGLPTLHRLARSAGWALLAGGTILLVQGLLLMGYTEWTARQSDLGDWAGRTIQWAGQFVGLHIAAGPGTLALHSMRQMHDFPIAYSLLLDPVSLGFLAGGLAWVLLRSWALRPPGGVLRAAWRPAAGLLPAVLLYLPFRVGLLLALYMHRVLRTDFEEPLRAMDQFWSTWVLLALQVVPVLLAWRFCRVSAGPVRPLGAAGPVGRERRIAASALAFAACAALTAAVLLDPVGRRKAGNIIVDEHTTDWEPTQQPYDTEWYGHLSGYNYACIYDYCSRFYRMSRLEDPVAAATLAKCDVLVVKVPLLSYSRREIDAIVDFVHAGGGLLLIGEHTDVFGTGRTLNAIAGRFGFRFRYDCLFGVDSFFDDLWKPPLVPHPAVQHMPPMDFATSCSIDPGLSPGRSIITGVGLKNLPADYHALNLYPQAEDRPDMRCGAFVQLWAARHGAGRVLAFTDSTIFSNFSTFEPGKAELMLGMIEWLNHHDEGHADPRWWLVAAAAILAGGCVLAGWGRPEGWVFCLAGAALGWAGSAFAARTYHRWAMPPPKPQRPMTTVVIDRTLSDAALSKGGFIGGRQDGFGLFERWCLRLGCFTARRSGPDAFTGDLLVLMHPHLPGDPSYRKRLFEYVESGGKVLVLDSPRNAASTTNVLLEKLGLSVGPVLPGGKLEPPADWPAVDVEGAYEVRGGQPLVKLGGSPRRISPVARGDSTGREADKTVAAEVRHGKGTVTLIGFASRFNDDQMGVTGDVEPGPELRKVFDLQFALVRHILHLPKPQAPATRPAQPGEP